MLMGAHNGGIDEEMEGVLVVLPLEACPALAPEAAPFPATKAVVDRVPVPKIGGEVTPGSPRTGEGQDGLDEQPITQCRGTPSTGFDGSEDGGNCRPHLVSQQQTHGHQVSSVSKV